MNPGIELDCEEKFEPVVALYPFAAEEEAMRSTPYR